MDETEGHYAKWNKPDGDRQVLYDITYMLKKKKSDLNRMGFPGGSVDEESACNAGDLGLIPGLGRSLEKEMATHSSILGLENLLDSGAWWAAVHGVAKSRARLSD